MLSTLSLFKHDAVVELSFDNFSDMLSTLEPAERSDASQYGKFFAEECNNTIVMVFANWSKSFYLYTKQINIVRNVDPKV